MAPLRVGLIGNLAQINRFATGNQVVWLCSAYLSVSGLEFLAPLLDTATKVYGVFGAGPLTEPRAIRLLLQRNADIRLFPHSVDSEFHAKCYLGLVGNGEAWTAVGSANLTGRGARGNVELLATMTGPVDAPLFVDLLAWLQELHSCALVPTDGLLESLQYLHEEYRGVTKVIQQVNNQLAATVTRTGGISLQGVEQFQARLHSEMLLTYIRSTQLFASYKLVILGLLLASPDGRLTLSECAQSFHKFYLRLEVSGTLPERRTGHPPPHMLSPRNLSTTDVEALILKEPKRAFRNSNGIVIYGKTASGQYIAIARSLWATLEHESRRAALDAVLDRLGDYYRRHGGSPSNVQQTLLSVIRELSGLL